MSLRFRLSLLITLVFLMILVGSGFFIIENARRAIDDEVRSSANLTLQLIEIAFEGAEGDRQEGIKTSFLRRINDLESSRHLTIQLLQRRNLEQSVPVSPAIPISSEAPEWFIKLVKPVPIEFRRVIAGSTMPIEIIIKANPSNEITEVWQETKGILVLLILFVVLSVALVYYTLGKGLKPIDKILTALEGIEQGNYQLRLPRFNLPELSRISEKFNHMAGVMQKSVDENRALTQKSLAIQEEERRHLAQELHDELGQSITAIKAVAVSINQQKSNTDSIKSSTDAIIEVSNRMYDVARNMMRRLRPNVLDELGLVPALQDIIDDWNTHHEDVFCNFNFSGDLADLGENINITLFRIVQESLTNVVKHADASKVLIELSRHKETREDEQTEKTYVKLEIIDDGIGFDKDHKVNGLGLLGMRERVESLNGNFQIQSQLNPGVKIELSIPI